MANISHSTVDIPTYAIYHMNDFTTDKVMAQIRHQM